jgi:hypothetical protein
VTCQNHQLDFETNEVDDVWPERHLSSKLEVGNLSTSDPAPKAPFSNRHVVAQLPGIATARFHRPLHVVFWARIGKESQSKFAYNEVVRTRENWQKIGAEIDDLCAPSETIPALPGPGTPDGWVRFDSHCLQTMRGAGSLSFGADERLRIIGRRGPN